LLIEIVEILKISLVHFAFLDMESISFLSRFSTPELRNEGSISLIIKV